MRYKSKPVVIEAVQWTGDNYAEVSSFAEDGFNTDFVDGVGTWTEVWDYLQATWVNVNLGDYIIRGTKNEYYPCAEDVFNVKYEPSNELGWNPPEFVK